MRDVLIAGTIVRREKRERPDIVIGWRDPETGELIDFTGASFRLTIATSASSTPLITKTAGIGYITNVPGKNIRIVFTPGELDTLAPGRPYNCQLDQMNGMDAIRGFLDFALLLTPEHS